MPDLVRKCSVQGSKPLLVLGHCGLQGHEPFAAHSVQGLARVRDDGLEDHTGLVSGGNEVLLDDGKFPAKVRELRLDLLNGFA